MDRVSPHVLRALWYVDLLAGREQHLSAAAVDRFAQAVPPRDAKRQELFLGSLSAYTDPFDKGKVSRQPEPVAQYLLKIGWIANSQDGLVLTDIGRIILKAYDQELAVSTNVGTDTEVADVALDPRDPLVYVQLTRRLQKAGPGLLVDSYFKAESLQWLIEATTLRRILISSRHPKSEKERKVLAVGLATVPNGTDVEIRHTSDPALHDRCVVGQDGSVQLLGTSVNGVGRHLTAVITPSQDIAQAYRKKYESLWDKAQALPPQPPQT